MARFLAFVAASPVDGHGLLLASRLDRGTPVSNPALSNQGGRARGPHLPIERHTTRMKRVISNILGFDAELADVLQDAFAAALSSLDRLHDPEALEPWLRSIAANTARKALRTRVRRRLLQGLWEGDDESYPEPAAAPPDLVGRRALRGVDAVLSTLPERERKAFVLRYIDGLDLSAVAAASGVSLATIKRRLGKAERLFRANARRHPELVHWLVRAPASRDPKG